MQIRIYVDGTFESLAAAKPKTAKEHSDRIKTLKKDVSVANKIEKKQAVLKKFHDAYLLAKQSTKTPQRAAKVAGLSAKVKGLRVEIKALKSELSTPRNATLARATEQLGNAQRAKVDHIKQFQPRNKVGSMHGAHQRAVRAETKPAKKPSVQGDNTAARLKAAGIKQASMPAAAKRNIKTLVGMKDHQEMAKAIAEGQATPNGMQNSSTVRNAGRLMAAHLSKAELAKVHKISSQHEAALNKIRNTEGSPTREQRLNARTQAKLNDSGIFKAKFDRPYTALGLINGITAAKPE